MCGGFDNLTFHHINKEDKLSDVASIVVGHGSVSQLVREIEKCACICRLCHDALHRDGLQIQLTPIRLRSIGVSLPIVAYMETQPIAGQAKALIRLY